MQAFNEDGYGKSQPHQATSQQRASVISGAGHCSLPAAPVQPLPSQGGRQKGGIVLRGDNWVTPRGTTLSWMCQQRAWPVLAQKWGVGEIFLWLRRARHVPTLAQSGALPPR